MVARSSVLGFPRGLLGLPRGRLQSRMRALIVSRARGVFRGLCPCVRGIQCLGAVLARRVGALDSDLPTPEMEWHGRFRERNEPWRGRQSQ